MKNQVTIRHATEDDLQPILDVYDDALINTTAIYQEEPHTLAMRKGWFREKQNAGIPVFAAEINRQFAGFSTYGPFRNWPGYRFTIEHSVYVKAGFRRLGIGRKLVQAVIDHGREKQLHVLIAGIDSLGEASINLHLSMGFTEVAHFKEVGFKFNKWLDVKFLQLML